jgi:hypothetical protein
MQFNFKMGHHRALSHHSLPRIHTILAFDTIHHSEQTKAQQNKEFPGVTNGWTHGSVCLLVIYNILSSERHTNSVKPRLKPHIFADIEDSFFAAC